MQISEKYLSQEQLNAWLLSRIDAIEGSDLDCGKARLHAFEEVLCFVASMHGVTLMRLTGDFSEDVLVGEDPIVDEVSKTVS